jgi:hypothetical protein
MISVNPRLRKCFGWLVGGVVALVVGAALFASLKPRPSVPLPNPNGYDSFVQAASLVSENVSDHRDFDLVTLRELVVSNSEALRLLRVGLTQQSVVPVNYSAKGITNLINIQRDMLDQLPGLKRLAHLLAAEGRLAELEERPADAVRSYVDCIRFGNESSRGGVAIQRLVGIACEAIGYQPLLNLLPRLSDAESRELISSLEEIRSRSVPWRDVWRAERRYMSQINRVPFLSVITSPVIIPSKLKTEQKDLAILSKLTLLSVELALRAHSAEHGKPPAQLKELSPTFLKEIPRDPFTGKPLVYRPQGTNWLLYSVGPDRVDNGGIPVTRNSPNTVTIGLPFLSITMPAGDVFYDSSW